MKYEWISFFAEAIDLFIDQLIEFLRKHFREEKTLKRVKWERVAY